MFCDGYNGFWGFWWIFPVIMMVLCFFMMFKRGGSMMCGRHSHGRGDNRRGDAADSESHVSGH